MFESVESARGSSHAPRGRAPARGRLAVLALLAALAWPVGPVRGEGPAETGARVAAIDLAPVPGDLAGNRSRLVAGVRAAARAGADWVVTPELALYGSLAPPAEADRLAEPLRGPAIELLSGLARDHGVHLVASLLESTPDGGPRLVTLVIDPEGEIAAEQRKVLVRSGREDGDSGRGDVRQLPALVLDRGLAVGLLSADDLGFGGERLARAGADIVLVTAGWQPADREPGPETARRLARSLRVDLVVANRQDQARTGMPGGVFRRDGEVEPTPAGGFAAARFAPSPAPPALESARGLPARVPSPTFEPWSPRLAEIGRWLFFDRRLSSTHEIACADCHRPTHAFADTAPLPRGVHDRLAERNSPSLLNVAFRPFLRWDGEPLTLEEFATYPVRGFFEMDNTPGAVVAAVRGIAEYRQALGDELGKQEIEFEDISRALAAYQRTLISGDSPFDRFRASGDPRQLEPAARRGLALFTGKLACARCHRIERSYALFTDFQRHPVDRGRFQTPSLRNVALTAPYLHDGRLGSLAEVVAWHARPGGEVPAGPVSAAETADLVAFLDALTGDHRFDAEGRRLP